MKLQHHFGHENWTIYLFTCLIRNVAYDALSTNLITQ